MTDLSKNGRTLPLQGSPRSVMAWLVVLAFGVPGVIVALVLGSAWKEGAPAAPLLAAGIFVLVPLSTLRANGVRILDLAAHPELKPVLRTWGIGLPGLASGWFRLRNGGKALCVLSGRERVTVLRTDDGTWVMLSLADTSALRSAID